MLIQHWLVQMQQGEESIQKDQEGSLLRRRLTVHEQQAYQGAKTFYYCFIPTTMIAMFFGHISVIQLYSKQETITLSFYQLVLPYVLIALSFLAYYLASVIYKQCNQLETTPIIKFPSLQEELTQTAASGEQVESPLVSPSKPEKYFCNECQIKGDYRTKHCNKCQVCIERFDHHCFWIGNCVGRHNHRPFFLFLLAQTVNNLLNCIILQQLTSRAEMFVTLPSILWWMLLALKLTALGFLIFTGYLLVYHCVLISNGITTWEQMRRIRINYLKYLPPGYNPFSRGFVQNWKYFFLQETRATGHQTVQEWENLIPTYQEARSIKPAFNIIQNQYYSCC